MASSFWASPGGCATPLSHRRSQESNGQAKPEKTVRWNDSRRTADKDFLKNNAASKNFSETSPVDGQEWRGELRGPARLSVEERDDWRRVCEGRPMMVSPTATSQHLAKDHEVVYQAWKQHERARSVSPPGLKKPRSSARRADSKDNLLLQLDHRLKHLLQGEPALRRQCAEGCMTARARSCEDQVLLRWAFSFFCQAASNARHAAELRRLEERLAETQENLRRSEQRAVCSEERLVHSEEIRRREKMRLCKAELDQRRCKEWRHDHEVREPAAARAVAIAILSASFTGFVRGVTSLVLTTWASLTARMKRSRAWKIGLEDHSAKCGISDMSSSGFATPKVVDAEVQEAACTYACPQGHALVDLVTPVAGLCDGCSKHTEPGMRVMDCRRCDWFLCDTCSKQYEDAASANTTAGEIVEVPRRSREGSCVWVDDEATEQLAEAVANMKAWRQRHNDANLLEPPQQRHDSA